MKSQKMKAIVCTTYGSPDVLQVQEVEIPSPKDQEILIRVYASAVTKADSMMRRADPFITRLFLGFTRPKKPITGTGFAGEVVALGKAVKAFKLGDQVLGETGVNFGANAEYVCMSEEGLVVHKPNNMSFEEAATLCDGPLTSFNFLKEMANIQKGQKVLINGASGSLGTSAVQLAKYFGAEVTGVCGPSNIEMVKSLGADLVIDYTQEDFSKNGRQYDIIYDTVGKSSYLKSRSSLSPKGVYLCPVLGFSLLFQMLWTSKLSAKKAKFAATGLKPVSELRVLLKTLISLFESKELKTILDRCYPLERTAEAHRYVDTGHKKGNVVVQSI